MNILFFIPARCGSKQIKHKNIYPLCGIPLISFSIMAIRRALPFFKKFEKKIIVSTDCNKIAKISKIWGIEVPFLRPKSISGDNADVLDAIFYTAERLERENNFKTELVILIQPTSPLVEPKDIINAFHLYLKNLKPIVSISQIKFPLFSIFNLKEGNLCIKKKIPHLRQAQKEKYYKPNGTIYISSLKDLKKWKSFYTKNTMGYLMDFENSIDIDYKEDLKIAKIMLEDKYKKERKEIEIAGNKIGEGNPLFFIAEAGVNHNGKLEIAKKLVDVAVEAGAEAVKFQTFKAQKVIGKGAKKADYQIKTTDPNESQLEMLKKLELSQKDFIELKEYCDKRKIIFLSTPFDLESLEFLQRLNVPAFKVGSGDLNNYFLLKEIAKKKKPLILSTGMAYYYEIFDSLALLENLGIKDVALLHCITNYPAMEEEANLNVIKNLKYIFRKPVGFSDHTLGDGVAIASLGLQPCIIEKHFTLDKNMEGPDHKASLSPEELKNLIKKIRNLRFCFGSGEKILSKEEEKNRKIVRRSLFAKSFIPKGTIIKEEQLESLRPGNGISPMEIEKVLGKRTKFDIESGIMIKFKHFKGA